MHFRLSSDVVSCYSKKQPIVTQSTEAEFVAAVSCTCWAIWMWWVLNNFNPNQGGGTTIFCDS